MYYVYILISKKDSKYYVGSTGDLKNRVTEHSNGKVLSTRYRLPLELIGYEAYQTKTLALRRERYLKSSDGHNDLDTRFMRPKN